MTKHHVVVKKTFTYEFDMETQNYEDPVDETEDLINSSMLPKFIIDPREVPDVIKRTMNINDSKTAISVDNAEFILIS